MYNIRLALMTKGFKTRLKEAMYMQRWHAILWNNFRIPFTTDTNLRLEGTEDPTYKLLKCGTTCCVSFEEVFDVFHCS